jgi:endonuclease/exonuclease/phosphatase (EEP) superfamily protein YafD
MQAAGGPVPAIRWLALALPGPVPPGVFGSTVARMRIATFNVNGVNGRLPVLLRWLEETSPDIVCLQELKSETFPLGAVRAAGYEAISCGQKSWNGVAILSRAPPRFLATRTTWRAATSRPPSTAS